MTCFRHTFCYPGSLLQGVLKGAILRPEKVRATHHNTDHDANAMVRRRFRDCRKRPITQIATNNKKQQWKNPSGSGVCEKHKLCGSGRAHKPADIPSTSRIDITRVSIPESIRTSARKSICALCQITSTEKRLASLLVPADEVSLHFRACLETL